MADKTLTVSYDVTLSAIYKRTDKSINPADLRDYLRYIDLKDSLANGNGNGRANLLYHQRSVLNNSTEYYNLDGVLLDSYGDTLNFDSVKCLIVKNRETAEFNFLEVTFKNEHWYIGPEGSRVAWEPFGTGIAPIVSSASFEEGRIAVSSNDNITYDIIIIGSESESSVSP